MVNDPIAADHAVLVFLKMDSYAELIAELVDEPLHLILFQLGERFAFGIGQLLDFRKNLDLLSFHQLFLGLGMLFLFAFRFHFLVIITIRGLLQTQLSVLDDDGL